MLAGQKMTWGQLFIILGNIFNYPRCTDSSVPGNFHPTPVDIFRSYQVGDILSRIPDKHVTLIYDSLTNALCGRTFFKDIDFFTFKNLTSIKG